MPRRGDKPHLWASLAESWEVDGRMVKRPVVGGSYLDVTADDACEAAGFPVDWRGDWTPLIRWLKADISNATIVEAIRSVASRPRLPPTRLARLLRQPRSPASERRMNALSALPAGWVLPGWVAPPPMPTADELDGFWTVVARQPCRDIASGWEWLIDRQGKLWASMVDAGEIGTVIRRRDDVLELLAARVPAGYRHLFQRFDQQTMACGYVRHGPVSDGARV